MNARAKYQSKPVAPDADTERIKQLVKIEKANKLLIEAKEKIEKELGVIFVYEVTGLQLVARIPQ